MLSAGFAEEVVDLGGGGKGERSARRGHGLRRIGKGLDAGDGLCQQVDEVGGLIGGLCCVGGEEETDMAAVDGLAAGAVIGKAVAQGDALKGMRGWAERRCEKARGERPDAA